MCGGIVTALSLGAPQAGMRQRLGLQLGYNLGRIASYTLAGALAGGLGAWAGAWFGLQLAQLLLKGLAGLFLVAMGLYVAGWWRGLRYVEAMGARWWRLIEPWGRHLLPVHTPGRAVLAGALWGWLPCGLVYSVVIWALSSGSALEGGLLLASFGLGTLPNLLLMGVFAARLMQWLQQVWVRGLLGGGIALYGLWQLWSLGRAAAAGG